MKDMSMEEILARIEVKSAEPNPENTVDPLKALARFLVAAYDREQAAERISAEGMGEEPANPTEPKPEVEAEGHVESHAESQARNVVVSVLAGLFMAHERSLTTFDELDLLSRARAHVWAQQPNDPHLWQEVNAALPAALLEVARRGYLSEESAPDLSGLRRFSLTEAALLAFEACLRQDVWELPDCLTPIVEPAEPDEGVADDPQVPPSRLRNLDLLKRAGLDSSLIDKEGVLYLIGPLPQPRGKDWWALAGQTSRGVKARHAAFAVGKLAGVFDELRTEGVLSLERLERETGFTAVKNHLGALNKRLLALELSPLRFQRQAGGYPTAAYPDLQRVTPVDS